MIENEGRLWPDSLNRPKIVAQHEAMTKPTRLTYSMPIWLLTLNVLLLLLFCAMLLCAWIRSQWIEDFRYLAFGFAGVISYFFPYEVASCTGRYGWTRNQWRTQPEGWVKFSGLVALGYGAYNLFNA
jgi:hypothetical protein